MCVGAQLYNLHNKNPFLVEANVFENFWDNHLRLWPFKEIKFQD